jgi:hypothetical protein
MGLALLVRFGTDHEYRNTLVVFIASLPIPICTLLLLRFGAVFRRLQAFLPRLLGNRISPEAAAGVDAEVQAALRRKSNVTTVGVLQLAALVSGAFEVWFALRLFGHPISAGSAIALESVTQALRSVAFMVPGGVGVQEGGLVLFGHMLGINGELALAVSMAKRLRELGWGLTSLLSWQWAEGRRLKRRWL